MAVSKRLRYEILRRDNHACRYCGATAPDVPLTVDHVIPTALGGSDKPDNLVAACKDCNAGKSASAPDAPIVDDVAADALRWGAAMQYAAELQRGQILDDEDFCSWFDFHWSRWRTGCGTGETLQRPGDWRNSVLRIRDSGLPKDLIEEAITVAMEAPGVDPDRRFRYFCGVCWRRLDDMQEVARQRLAAEEGEPSGA